MTRPTVLDVADAGDGRRPGGAALRPGRRPALRRHLGVHQVGARLRRRRGAALPGPDGRGGGGPAVHRPAAGDPGVGGHRAGRPDLAARRGGGGRRGGADRDARGADQPGPGGDPPDAGPEVQRRGRWRSTRHRRRTGRAGRTGAAPPAGRALPRARRRSGTGKGYVYPHDAARRGGRRSSTRPTPCCRGPTTGPPATAPRPGWPTSGTSSAPSSAAPDPTINCAPTHRPAGVSGAGAHSRGVDAVRSARGHQCGTAVGSGPGSQVQRPRAGARAPGARPAEQPLTRPRAERRRGRGRRRARRRARRPRSPPPGRCPGRADLARGARHRRTRRADRSPGRAGRRMPSSRAVARRGPTALTTGVRQAASRIQKQPERGLARPTAAIGVASRTRRGAPAAPRASAVAPRRSRRPVVEEVRAAARQQVESGHRLEQAAVPRQVERRPDRHRDTYAADLGRRPSVAGRHRHGTHGRAASPDHVRWQAQRHRLEPPARRPRRRARRRRRPGRPPSRPAHRRGGRSGGGVQRPLQRVRRVGGRSSTWTPRYGERHSGPRSSRQPMPSRLQRRRGSAGGRGPPGRSRTRSTTSAPATTPDRLVWDDAICGRPRRSPAPLWTATAARAAALWTLPHQTRRGAGVSASHGGLGERR